MHIGYHKTYSTHLEQDMELKVYGESGTPLLVFPTQEGRFFEFEDFGMVTVCKPFIESGQLQLYTVDSIDSQTWTHPHKSVPDRVHRYEQYEAYILDEMMPFLLENNTSQQLPIVTGCSMGAYHAANFFFRNPEYFSGLLSISGVYQLSLFIGNYMDEPLYYHTPLAFLKNMNDPKQLQKYRDKQIIVSVGQGAWEDDMLADTRELEQILKSKNIGCWIDYWGHDVDHDWPWWRKKMAYFLIHLNL